MAANNINMLLSFAYITFCHLGVSQGEGKATAPRCSQQRSNASHHHPAALVPGLFVEAALFAKEGCRYAYTGAVRRFIYLAWCTNRDYR